MKPITNTFFFFVFQILEPINNLLDTVDFDAVFYSLDWHPSDHVSFIDNVKIRPLDENSPVKLYKYMLHGKQFEIKLIFIYVSAG